MEVLARLVRQEKEIKGIQVGKEEAKLFLFIGDMILYIRNPRNPLEIITTNKQVQQGYRTQDQYKKNLFYFYTPVNNPE